MLRYFVAAVHRVSWSCVKVVSGRRSAVSRFSHWIDSVAHMWTDPASLLQFLQPTWRRIDTRDKPTWNRAVCCKCKRHMLTFYSRFAWWIREPPGDRAAVGWVHTSTWSRPIFYPAVYYQFYLSLFLRTLQMDQQWFNSTKTCWILK